MRAAALCCAVLVAAHTLPLRAQAPKPSPLPLLDVPFISQSELLCGGAAAAMILRYWGERGVSAESFAGLVDHSASGIRTDVLVADLMRRGWAASVSAGSAHAVGAEIARGRPVLTLIEDRASTFHYIVVVAAHERGIVFHDPARAPFMVMSAVEFDRRWRAAGRWMAVVVPGTTSSRRGSSLDDSPRQPSPTPLQPSTGMVPTTPCEQVIAEGIRQAQANDLDAAERTLSAALGCPGAMRELAGLRVLQKRWGEASDLAMSAVEADQTDTYAWKVLATSRFVQDDRLGALAAWNQVGEPRLDLVRFEGLIRTRHRSVERLVQAIPGEILSPSDFMRARRRLAELPSAASTRLEYAPVPGGLAVLHGAISERPLLPTGRLPLAASALSAAATRELRVTFGSLLGGGESIQMAWRFWKNRPRLAVGVAAPAPWGGVLSVQGYTERQPFSLPSLSRAERTGGRLEVADWLAARWRWTLSAGIDEWSGADPQGTAGATLQFASLDGRVEARAGGSFWRGDDSFAIGQTKVHVRSSTELIGLVFEATAGVEMASRETPLDLWPAGDTGHVRSGLMRAHPALDHGRLRVEQLGRRFVHGSIEVQHWRRVGGPLRVAAAAFGDVGRTGDLFAGGRRRDVDLGVGARAAITGISGTFRANLAKGLRDGATAISLTYQP